MSGHTAKEAPCYEMGVYIRAIAKDAGRMVVFLKG